MIIINNFVIAQVFGTLGIIASVLSMQFKKRKHILIALFMLNLFCALNFLFLGNMTSAYICFFAEIEMLVNYAFEKNNKNVPKLVIGIYILINILLGMITFKNALDVMPIICAILYCGTILTKKETNIRKLMFGNQVLWLIFDFIVKAYASCINAFLTVCSILIAMYRYDYKKK